MLHLALTNSVSLLFNSQTFNPMSRPLIFIHYGAASYLRYTLQAARRSNPDKRIILLGDVSNQKFAKGVAEHICFQELESGDRLANFDRIFQVIQGSRHRFTKLHGTEFWLRFVFRRWFLIQQFLEKENIDSFWTFDSDTLVLAPLTQREARFADYDCTEQCRGECLNGFVSSRDLVVRYVDTINELFSDQVYLESQRQRLNTHSGLAFNEMDAYKEFKVRAQLRTIRASEPIDGEVFDDALAFTEDYVLASNLIGNRTKIKQLVLHPAGLVYGKHQKKGIVRFITLNLSWMPIYIFRRLARMATPSNANLFVKEMDFDALPNLDIGEPISLHLARFYWALRRRISWKKNLTQRSNAVR